MRALRFGSYSTVATRAGTPSVLRYTRLVRAKAKRNRSGCALVTEALQDVQKKQFLEHVESVCGYTLSSGKEVTTAEEFYETADKLLVEEVLKAMESSAKLSEAQRKNSERGSVGN